MKALEPSRLIKLIEDHSPTRYAAVVVVPVFFLTVGFLVWNTYLAVFGLSAEEIIRGKFIAAGLTFSLISLGVFLAIDLLKRTVARIPWRKSGMRRSRENKPFPFLMWLLTFLVWWFAYVFLFFPSIPELFGGGRPIALGLVATDANMQVLNSIDIPKGPGALNQTVPICVFNQDSKNVYMLMSNRVVVISRNIVDGAVSLPGEINYRNEGECTKLAYRWIYTSTVYGIVANGIKVINPILQATGKPPLDVTTQQCAPT